MTQTSKEQRIQIFKEELLLLKRNERISQALYERVLKEHVSYYQSIDKPPFEGVEPKKTKEIPEKLNITKAKKVRSAEQIRERNISILLNIGVILLLIGGLFVATSNWATMSGWMKAALIGMISSLFFGLSFVSTKFLQIKQTAFAFTVLGSLFMPIFLLSVGWFKLFGEYLSVTGDGKYLFGAICSFVLAPIYFLFSKRLKARLFVWFTYISTSVGVGFILGQFSLGRDEFYLGMILYQSLLIMIYRRLTTIKEWELYTKEFVSFFQISLIVITISMLFIYDNHLFNGINILLTACIYLATVYVSGKKEFHFVFTLLIVYGAYQVIHNSIFHSAAPIFFALIGSLFLIFPLLLDEQYPWQRIFSITSTIITILTFFYISIDPFLSNLNEPTLIIMLAYGVLAINFYFISMMLKQVVFHYITAVFIAASLLQLVLWFNTLVHLNSSLTYFFVGFALVVLFGNLVPSIIQVSSRDIGFVYSVGLVILTVLFEDWWEGGVMLALLASMTVSSQKRETRDSITHLMSWLFPVLIGFSVMSFCQHIRVVFPEYLIPLNNVLDAVLTTLPTILLLGISFILRSRGRKISTLFFLVGHGFLIPSLIFALLLQGTDALYCFAISTLIYGLSLRVVTEEWQIKFSLYSAFLSLYFTTHLLIDRITGEGEEYAYFITSVILVVGWFLSHSRNRLRINYFQVPFAVFGLLSILNAYPWNFIYLVVLLVYAAGLLLLLYKINWQLVSLLPLLSIWAGVVQAVKVLPFDPLPANVFVVMVGIVILIVGQKTNRFLFNNSEEQAYPQVDMYTPVALLLFFSLFGIEKVHFTFNILPGLLIALTLLLQRKRVPLAVSWVPMLLGGIVFLHPYYEVLSWLQIPRLFEMEFNVLPLIVISVFFNFILKEKQMWKRIGSVFQWCVLIIVSILLIIDGLKSSTIYDALIIGTLSLASIMIGTSLKIKSYFFVGAGVLLLNVLLQTRPYWGNLPWWAYLLLSGSVLIVFASYNEWQKQKASRKEETLLAKWRRKSAYYFKNWR